MYYHYVLNKHTQSYNLRFKKRINHTNWRVLKRKLEININTEEDSQIEAASNCILEEDKWPHDKYESEEEREPQDLTNKYPPCIRAILLKSNCTKDDLGSLYVIPYTGGSIGKGVTSNVINFPTKCDVENVHAFVEYDLLKKNYFIQGILHFIMFKF